VPYKLDFYRAAVRARREAAPRGQARAGDGRPQHRAPRDRPRAPEAEHENSGFLPEERAELDRWIAAGWIDTFRAFEPGAGHYSWWSQRFGMRAKNIGWRIDYVLASPSAMPFVRGAFIERDAIGSDTFRSAWTVDTAIFG
jgi:exodeoxyribonuclease-3